MAEFRAAARWWWAYNVAPFFAGFHVPAHELERCGERPFVHIGLGILVELPR